MICKDCGGKYRGHFNSRYCDSCLLANHKEYYEYRIYLEEDGI